MRVWVHAEGQHFQQTAKCHVSHAVYETFGLAGSWSRHARQACQTVAMRRCALKAPGATGSRVSDLGPVRIPGFYVPGFQPELHTGCIVEGNPLQELELFVSFCADPNMCLLELQEM